MGVTVDETTGRVTELQLKDCGLKGHLPPELAFLSNLETLDLRDNPDLDVPIYAKDLGLLDVTGQMHFTDKVRVQAFLKHVALTEGKKEDALLVQKHGPDGPALKRIYDDWGSPKFAFTAFASAVLRPPHRRVLRHWSANYYLVDGGGTGCTSGSPSHTTRLVMVGNEPKSCGHGM